MTRRVQDNRAAFTLIEIMVSLTIIAVVAVVVLPQLRNTDRLRVLAASQILISDIEAAQVLTISFPSEPIVVRFDPDNNRYWLAEASAPDTPIVHQATGEDYIVVLGEGRADSADGVAMTLTNVTDNTVVFNESGSLADFTTAPIIRLQRGDSVVELIIAPTTGTVIEQTPS